MLLLADSVAFAKILPTNFEEENSEITPSEPATLKVWSITFKGNSTFSDIVLKQVIAHKEVPVLKKTINANSNLEGFDFSELELKKDVIRLNRFYNRRGFYAAQITYKVTEGDAWWKRNIEFIIKEFNPIRISDVAYVVTPESYDSLIFSDRIIQKKMESVPFKPGKRYEPIRVKEIQGIFEKELKRLGFPFAQVEIKARTDTLANKSTLRIHLIPHQLAYIDSIKIVGDLTVSEQYVLKEGGLKIGMLYNQEKLMEAQQELINHQLFRFVTLNIPDQPIDSTVTIILRLQEHPLRNIMVRGGIGTEEIVRAELSWGHLNPFGNAHQIGTRIRTSLNNYGTFRMARIVFDYSIPYLYNTKSGLRTSPFIEARNEYSYNLGRFGINNSFLYQHSLALQSIVSYEYTVNRIAEKTTRAINRDSLKLYNISSVKLASFFRQAFIDRKPGWYINPNIEFSGFAGLGTYRYDKFYLDLRRYVAISNTAQFALKTHIGYINVQSAENIPAADRFYAGGTSSVRGWMLDNLGPKRVLIKQDGSFDSYVPIGGKALFAFSTEIRQKFSFWKIKGLGFAAFLDGGQIWKSISDIDIMRIFSLSTDIYSGTLTNKVQYGTGIGLSYDTPIGPIRIDMAYQLNPTQADLGYFEGQYYLTTFRRWALHFSIGQPF